MATRTEDQLAAYWVEGSRVQPTDYSRGPWHGDQQHGACVLGLMTRFLERVPSRSPMRLTLEKIIADAGFTVGEIVFSDKPFKRTETKKKK